MNLDERLALGGAFSLIAAALLDLGDWNAEAIREDPQRFAEADFLLELDVLEDVAANTTAEAVEEPLLLVDAERRRLLSVKRAEALVLRPCLAQRHGVRDDGDNVGRRTNFVDEGLRELQDLLEVPHFTSA